MPALFSLFYKEFMLSGTMPDNPYPQIINKDIHKLSTLSTIGYPELCHGHSICHFYYGSLSFSTCPLTLKREGLKM